MTFQQDIRKAGEDIAHAGKKAVDTVKDAANETAHRLAAAAEKHKRETLGDTLTPEEKVKSVLDEKKNDVQANVDAAKKTYDAK